MSGRRAKPGHTFAPCGACNGERQHASGEQRPKDAPCWGCQRLLRRADQIIELHRQASADQRLQVDPRVPRVRLLNVETLLGWRSEIEADLQAAITQLGEATGLDAQHPDVPAEYLVPYPHIRESYDRGRRFGRSLLFSPKQIEAFETIVVALEQALSDAYAAGHAAGADLLGRLARGDTTLFDLGVEQERVQNERAKRFNTPE